MIYSNEVLEINNGIYLIKNYKKNKILLSSLCLFVSAIFLCVIIIFIKDMEKYPLFYLFYPICVFISLIYIANDVKEIIFNINERRIIFKYGLFIKKIRVINIDDLKEISINYARINVPHKRGIILRNEYNIDLIDKNLNAYRIYKSVFYNEELKLLAKNINKILNVELIDKNSVEGYMKIFKKRII